MKQERSVFGKDLCGYGGWFCQFPPEPSLYCGYVQIPKHNIINILYHLLSVSCSKRVYQQTKKAGD